MPTRRSAKLAIDSAGFQLASAAIATATMAWSGSAAARDVPVADAASLRAAIEGATAGDVVLLADGVYDLDANLRCNAAGTASAPIVVRSVNPRGARLRSTALEGFVVAGAHWHFEALDIEGRCADHSACEHAFHIVGDADGTILRENRVQGFNAHIKANGAGDPRVWPDDVLIEGNELFNPTPRMTSNPVTPIDVVGGRRWVIRGNFIHDHRKDGGDGISYAAFLKGNGADGVIERNLVVCELLHAGGTRLGLSFGGGGSGPANICEEGTCEPEHRAGIMRNNIVAHCPEDVGVYVNECSGCLVAHNTLYDSGGIDVRFGPSDVRVVGNLMAGRARARDGATLDATGNRENVGAAEWRAWFRDPDALDFSLVDGAEVVDRGMTVTGVADDYCGNRRDDGRPDLGAVEFDGDGVCDTSRPGASGGVDAGIPVNDDAGVSAGDGGGATPDAGPTATTDGAVGGVADGGVAEGGGARRDGATAGEDESDGDCSCHVAGRSDARPAFGLGAFGLLLALRRRRRR